MYNDSLDHQISIIIPCRNEEKNIPLIIPALLRLYNKYIFNIIVVDDCSNDNTKSAALKMVKRFSRVKYIQRTIHPGVGNALKEGISHVSHRSNYILFMDCDFIFNVLDVARMINKIRYCDGVVGSRFINKKSLIDYPIVKKIANRTYHLLIYHLFGYRQKDVTNNFKLYRKELVYNILPILQSSDFAINAELGYFPLMFGAKIEEIPVVWKERTAKMGISKFKVLLTGPSYFRVLIRMIKYNFLSHI